MNKTIEAIAAIIGRELSAWTPQFKSKAVWPTDYSDNEIRAIRNTATIIYDMMLSRLNGVAALTTAEITKLEKLPNEKDTEFVKRIVTTYFNQLK